MTGGPETNNKNEQNANQPQFEPRLSADVSTVAVPTNDDLVRQQLRRFHQTVEITAESRAERRERLRRFLVAQNHADLPINGNQGVGNSLSSEAPPSLVSARQRLARCFRIESASARAPPFRGELYASQSGFVRPVSALTFLTDDLVAVGDYGGGVSVLDLAAEMKFVRRRSVAGGGRITSLSAHCSMRGQSLVTGSLSGGCHLWSKFDELEVQQTFNSGKGGVNSASFHYTGDWFVLGGGDGAWQLFDVTALDPLMVQRTNSALNCSEISADGCVLATGGGDADIGLYDLRNGIRFAELADHADEVRALAWHPDAGQGYLLVSGGGDNRCLVWDLRQPSQPLHTVYAHTNAITDIAYDGTQLVTASLDESVKVWDCGEYSLVKQYRSGTKITGVGLRNHRLVAGRWDRQVDMYT